MQPDQASCQPVVEDGWGVSVVLVPPWWRWDYEGVSCPGVCGELVPPSRSPGRQTIGFELSGCWVPPCGEGVAVWAAVAQVVEGVGW